MLDKVKQILSDIFDVPLEETNIIQYGQHHNWDSMRHFLLILALEDIWEKEIDEKTASKLKSLKDIMQVYDNFLN
jgi:acyl carrier protein